MSDLAVSLVDTVAKVLPEACHESVRTMETFRDRWRIQARAASVALLDLLVEHFAGIDESDCHPADTLRRLAGEVREATDV